MAATTELQILLAEAAADTIPILQLNWDRLEFYPGSAFHGLAHNAYHEAWRATFLNGNSGDEWFSIFLDAPGVSWDVDYMQAENRMATMTTPTCLSHGSMATQAWHAHAFDTCTSTG